MVWDHPGHASLGVLRWTWAGADLSLSYLNVAGGKRPVFGLPCGEERASTSGSTLDYSSYLTRGHRWAVRTHCVQTFLTTWSCPSQGTWTPLSYSQGEKACVVLYWWLFWWRKQLYPGLRYLPTHRTFFFLNEKSVWALLPTQALSLQWIHQYRPHLTWLVEQRDLSSGPQRYLPFLNYCKTRSWPFAHQQTSIVLGSGISGGIRQTLLWLPQRLRIQWRRVHRWRE